MNNQWTDKELETLEEMACLYSVKQIAYRLKRRGYKRSTSAIQNKLRSLGYSARPVLDNYNCCEIARVLQLNSATVWSWVNKGWIRTTRRSGRYYQIKSKDLKRFLQNPPQRIKNRIAAIDKDAIEYLVGELA
ncbi:helix-turn-helix domain-containing protein [Nostoc sp. UHCC 0302]|uniref:helix-turn-helix domain-containing protein n=1 Tax=Nostoc sp. UHCC 0302 TaxID=3134896 RepID=UPI00311CC81B